MPDFNTNIWAPWRMEYIRSLDDESAEDGCFLCKYWETPQDDAANHVLWRGKSALVALNRFPYTNCHLLIAPAEHLPDVTDLSAEQFGEMNELIRTAVGLLRQAVRAEGFNIGYNLGRCAGAGLPGHVHAHIVPRWAGDTNYMTVIGEVRVVPDALDAAYAMLVEHARAAGLRD